VNWAFAVASVALFIAAAALAIHARMNLRRVRDGRVSGVRLYSGLLLLDRVRAPPGTHSNRAALIKAQSRIWFGTAVAFVGLSLWLGWLAATTSMVR
jgi:hypothetical protein